MDGLRLALCRCYFLRLSQVSEGRVPAVGNSKESWPKIFLCAELVQNFFTYISIPTLRN